MVSFTFFFKPGLFIQEEEISTTVYATEYKDVDIT